MGLDMSKMLTPSRAPFYSIIPGNMAIPLSSVVLPVTFGMKDNYRTKYIKFEEGDFKSSYHAILGRLALAKSMVVPATQDAKQDRRTHVPQRLEKVVRLRPRGDRVCRDVTRAREFCGSTRGRAKAH
jgi:hypothetical protein